LSAEPKNTGTIRRRSSPDEIRQTPGREPVVSERAGFHQYIVEVGELLDMWKRASASIWASSGADLDRLRRWPGR